MSKLFLVLLAFFTASPAFARGGGGCVAEGTQVSTPTGKIAIEALRIGDEVLSGDPARPSRVLDTVAFEAGELWEISTALHSLKLTFEHPVALPGGAYRFAGSLRPGDLILTESGAERVHRVERIPGPARVYNLVTSWPSRFTAGSVLVHNKGCFLPETPVRLAGGGEKSIANMRPGDEVRAFTPAGELTTALVRQVFTAHADHYFEITTKRGFHVRATPEHPFYVGDGLFRTVESLREGDPLVVFAEELVNDEIQSLRRIDDAVTVYNLQTDAPNTFLAAGFAVHNKGGGFGGGYHGGSGGYHGGYDSYRYRPSYYYRSSPDRMNCSSTPDENGRYRCENQTGFWPATILLAFFVIVVLLFNKAPANHAPADLIPDFAFREPAGRTRALLARIAAVNPAYAPDTVINAAREAFLNLQRCWEARDYGPMRAIVTPGMREEHERLLQNLRDQHEINRIQELKVDFLTPVRVVASAATGTGLVTLLIQAQARDFYVDDRTNSFIRGDRSAAVFQEFWTFQLSGNRWLLSEIDQVNDTTALKEESSVDLPGVADISGAPNSGPVGGTPNPKTSRPKFGYTPVERELSGETPDIEVLRGLSRRAGLAYLHALEKQDVSLLRELAAPAYVARFETGLRRLREERESVQFHNLCVRGVRFVSVNGRTGRKGFGARVSFHAQRSFSRGGSLLRQDADLTIFEEVFFFDRDANGYRLVDSGRGQAPV